MSSPWIPVAGTAIGVGVGAFATFSAQWTQWRRERAARWDPSRKETYAEFLATGDRYHEALWGVVYQAKHRRDLKAAWNEANGIKGDLVSQHASVELLSGPASRDAAQEIFDRLEDFRGEIYRATGGRGDPDSLSTLDEYYENYEPLRQHFLEAARSELVVDRRSRWHPLT
jgi:hypothetical protein